MPLLRTLQLLGRMMLMPAAKKKKKSGGAVANGQAAAAAPTQQTTPPTVPVKQLFPSGEFPEGERQSYKDECVAGLSVCAVHRL